MERTESLGSIATVPLPVRTGMCQDCGLFTTGICPSCEQPWCINCCLTSGRDCGDHGVCHTCHYYRCTDPLCGTVKEVPA